MRHSLYISLAFLLGIQLSYGQQNGKFQLHFIDVGQGDAALLVTPGGETVLFDNGVANHCNLPIDYLKKIGIKKIDYLITSHYHDDHIGCTRELLQEFPLSKVALDDGRSYSSDTFSEYLEAIGGKRRTTFPEEKITLDSCSATPVVITIIATKGAGVETDNENDLSLVALIRFGSFDAVMGGDLSGFNKNGYSDIESVIAKKVGQVEVYKVHHHCSSYSSNNFWLATINPKVGIISASSTIGRNYHHPTAQCLNRLHNANITTYWTELTGSVAPIQERDRIGENIIIEADPKDNAFVVKHGGTNSDFYHNW